MGFRQNYLGLALAYKDGYDLPLLPIGLRHGGRVPRASPPVSTNGNEQKLMSGTARGASNVSRERFDLVRGCCCDWLCWIDGDDASVPADSGQRA